MKLREVLDTAKASMTASYKEVVKDEPEESALNEGFALGVTYAADKFKALDDAEVYGLDTGKVSVVTAELRELADDALCAVFAAHRTGFGATIRAELLDAVLSTVLGDVRTAKEVRYDYHSDTDGYASPIDEWLDADGKCHTGRGIGYEDVAVLEDEK